MFKKSSKRNTSTAVRPQRGRWAEPANVKNRGKRKGHSKGKGKGKDK